MPASSNERSDDAYRVFRQTLESGHPPDDWDRLLAEAQKSRDLHLQKLMALKPVEVNVRHLIARTAAHKENEELVGWAERRLRSLGAL